MSEASGKGVKDWSFFLSPQPWARKIPGVEYIGTSPGLRYRYVMPSTNNSHSFSLFLDERSTELAAIEPPSLDVVNSEFVPPSEAELFKHVSGFGSSGPDGTRLSTTMYASLLRELRQVEGMAPPLSGWMDARILTNISVPSQTSPGIRWKKLGYRTKRAALMPAIREATVLMNRMIERGEEYEVPPCGVAGRGKRMSLDRVSGVKKEGRLIVMPDLVHHLLGTMASGPLLGQLRTARKDMGGVLLGMGPFSDNYQMISEWCRGAKSYFFLDFSGFDQSVPDIVLRKVMGYVAEKFEPTPGSKAYWAAQSRNLINTRIAMPDGSTYVKKRGVASGDPWTSIAGSYSNWIMLRHVCNQLGIEAKIWTFGDDSIIAVYDRVVDKGDLRALSSCAHKYFGMNVSVEKSYTSEHLVDVAPDPKEKQSGSFLSMYFLQTPMGVRPTRPLQDMYELMLVPERNRETLQWEIVRTSMAYMVFYYNDDARYVLEEYWDWIHHKYKVPELSGTSSDLALLREMDIPWSSFKWEWLNRLPRPGEVELMYKYGHTGYYAPSLWAAWYSKHEKDPLGNELSFRLEDKPPP